nr:hypothetical protein [Paraflavitalea speifideiaquila]
MVGGSSDRGVVASCSYEARTFGVHSAMPMKLARRMCPQAIIRQGDMESYSKYSHLVTDIIADTVPSLKKHPLMSFMLTLPGWINILDHSFLLPTSKRKW